MLAIASGVIHCLPLPAQRDELSDEPVFELSPFEVSVDGGGYIASNSMSATGINVPILDLPMPIEVITSDFLRDTGAVNLTEALSYAAGVFSMEFEQGGGGNRSSTGGNIGSVERSPSTSSSPNNPFSNTYNIRGFNVPTQQRSGFRVGGSVAEWQVTFGGLIEPVNVDRIEVVRGPQSLLYGVSVISGVINVMPKRPQPVQSQSISLTYGSDNFQRGTFDITGPTTVLNNLNYRVNAALSDYDGWDDFRSTTTAYLAAQLEYRPAPKTRFLFEVQYGNARIRGIGPKTIRDTRRTFDVLIASSLVGVEPVIFENRWGEFYDWARDANNIGSSRFSEEARLKPFGDFGPEYRISGPDTSYKREEWNGLLETNINLAENLDLSFGAFFSEQNSEEFNVSMETIINTRASLNVGRDAEPAPFAEEFTYLDNEEHRAGRLNDDFRVIGYSWFRAPMEGSSQQYRAQMNYSFETPFFLGDIPALHRVFAGAQYTSDEFDYTTNHGAAGYRFQQIYNPDDNNGFGDPLYFRNIFDFEPLRYSGETLAIPHVRFINTKLWFAGIYGVYEGRLWNDRLTLIIGGRRDIYNGKDRQYRRPGDMQSLPGELPYEVMADGRIDYNGANRSYGFYTAEERPGFGRNFEKDIVTDTATLALGIKLTENLNLYFLTAEGISPNTGLVDGNHDAIEAELTKSKEVGLKWSLLKGNFSGSVSVYQIDRDNAVWNFTDAPAPALWRTGVNPAPSVPFDPRDALVDPSDPRYAPRTYMVHQSFFIGQPEFDNRGRPLRVAGKLPDGVWDTDQAYNALVYDKVRDPDHPLHDVIETAFHTPQTALFRPIAYDRLPPAPHIGNTASSATGANSTFTDQAQGIDLQFYYRATRNWSIIASYSHTKREAKTPLKLLSPTWTNPETGESYMFGTEYDVWVYRLGREAFSDTDYSDGLDPATHDSGGVKGLSLFFNAENTFNLWNRYEFAEGALEGLSVGLGLNYTGPRRTSIPIGGSQMLENQFPTPRLPSRHVLNGMIAYERRYSRFDLRLQLNVNNLLNHTVLFREVEYEDLLDLDEDGNEFRRAVAYFAPRSFRLSLQASF